MGMWDKDREYGSRPEDVFGMREPFLLLDAYCKDPVQTRIGDAVPSVLVGCRIGPAGPGTVMTGTTLASAIADKVREAEAGDLPAVVQLMRVQGNFGNDALVLQFVAPWQGAAPEAPPRNGGR